MGTLKTPLNLKAKGDQITFNCLDNIDALLEIEQVNGQK